MQNLINEASFLAQRGVKELLIIAQDISSYGIDLSESSQLSRLIEKLSEIKGIEWIRLHYAYPKDFPKDLLRVINDNPKVCKYLDIPFQHISDNMLQKMRRGINKDKTIRLIENIRSAIPGIALRTTLLVGHPGETEKDFEELVKFVQDTRFDRLGVFKYSHEENTYSAANYTDNVSIATKNKRADIIMSIQKNISMETNKKAIGREYKVIIDRKEDSLYIGRTQFDSPEIDNEVIVRSTKPIKIGNFYTIRIKESSEYDLIGDRV
jgi:ribosomal protein S12 methylthiotransferase